MKKIFIAAIIICACASCSNFYKTITTNSTGNSTTIRELIQQHKYFILRDSSMAYAMNNISISADGKTIHADLASLPDEHMTHMWKAPGNKPKYDKSYEANVANEVHLYSLPDNNMAPGPYTMPVSNVWKTEILEKDITRTRRNHTKVILLSVVGTVVIVGGGLALAAASSLNWGGH